MSRRASQKGPPIVAIERKEIERLLKVAEEQLPQTSSRSSKAFGTRSRS